MNRSLSVKFVFFFSLTFFVVIAVTAWLSYLNYYERWKAEMNRTHIALVHQIQQKVELILKEVDKNTVVFMQEPELNRYIEDNYSVGGNKYVNYITLSDKMKALLYSNSYISSLYIYSNMTRQVLTDRVEAPEGQFYDLSWINALSELSGYYRWLPTRTITELGDQYPVHRNVVSLLRTFPMIGSPDFRKGAVVVNIDEKVLHALIESVDRERAGQTFIVNREHAVISHKNKELLFQPIWESFAISAADMQDESGWFEQSTDRGRDTVYYVTSPYTGWKYVSVIPHVEISRQMEITRNVLLAIAAGMFLIASFLVFTVSRYAVNPFDRFTRSMSELLTKHRKMRLEGPSSSALNQLEQTFTEVLTDNESMQRQIREGLPALRWRMVMDMLLGYQTNYLKLRPYMETLGLTLGPAHYMVMILDYDRILEHAKPSDIPLYSYALCNVTEEFIRGVCLGAAIEQEGARVVAILSFEEDDAETNQMRAFQIADLIKNYAKKHFKLTVTVGIGRHYAELESVSVSYKEALEAIRYKPLFGGNTVISLEDIEGYTYGEYLRLFNMAEAIAGSIPSADEQKMLKQVNGLFTEAVARSVPPELVRQLCVQMLVRSLRFVSEKESDLKRVFDPIPNVYEDIHSFQSAAEMKTYTEQLLAAVIRHLAGKRSAGKAPNKVVAKAIEAINDQYGRHDMSLNALADQFQLSVPYVSKLFKDHTDMNFMDYLIRVRMEKAKALLEDFEKKIADVAEEVGYTNAHSFIRIFKKYTGKTPGDYRDHLKWSRMERGRDQP